ncbi:MAG: AsnC family transcriptional regulator [Gammaproteobacteria bacterium]|jgi:DNA-binding Lrp family transcriptional regulator|nr:AsnC family transcriptional regulator [Gammaproteobacteria bacterium]
MNNTLSELDKRLLNDFQRDFPLSNTPFADLALELGISQQEVIEKLRSLAERGAVSRIGAVLRPKQMGASTLAAMAVPKSQLDQVARLVNGYPHVNHNYEREHRYNLWFVVTAGDEDELQYTLQDIEQHSGIPVLSLPMLDDYHIDLGFELQWD